MGYFGLTSKSNETVERTQRLIAVTSTGSRRLGSVVCGSNRATTGTQSCALRSRIVGCRVFDWCLVATSDMAFGLVVLTGLQILNQLFQLVRWHRQ